MFIETKAWHWNGSENPMDLVLKIHQIEPLADHQVLIENKAIGLNPVDWKLMSGFSKDWKQGQIPGVDGMGVVVAVGKNMRHIRIGSRYTYHTDCRFHGSYSHHTVVDGRALIAVPERLNNISAAAFPCPSLTAWQAYQKLPNYIGKAVLINGAGGSVGTFLTQLLSQAGAKTYVTASKHRHQTLLDYGAIAAFDYHDRDWQHHLHKTLAGQQLYAAYDTVSGRSAADIASLLGFYGHLICIQDRIEQTPLPAFTTSISLHEIALASTHAFGSDQQWACLVQEGRHLLEQIADYKLRLPQINTVQFEGIPEALCLLKQNNNGIKYVANID